MRPLYESIQNEMEQSIYGRKIADRLGVKQEWLKKAGRKPLQPSPKAVAAIMEFPEEERTLIAALVLKPEIIPTLRDASIRFTHPALQTFFEQLFLQPTEENISLGELSNIIDPTLASWIREMALMAEEESFWNKAVEDCVKKMTEKNLAQQLSALNKEILLAEKEGNEQKLLELLKKKHQLTDSKLKGRITPL